MAERNNERDCELVRLMAEPGDETVDDEIVRLVAELAPRRERVSPIAFL